MTKKIDAPTVGEILNEEFMIPYGISAYKLAQDINVPVSRIQVAGDITSTTYSLAHLSLDTDSL